MTLISLDAVLLHTRNVVGAISSRVGSCRAYKQSIKAIFCSLWMDSNLFFKVHLRETVSGVIFCVICAIINDCVQVDCSLVKASTDLGVPVCVWNTLYRYSTAIIYSCLYASFPFFHAS